ncbi:hypothetical protein DXG01_008316 [Tephrocybe rancida]|nr:hypothetical protein DXG01_008316 [Tephrocybe rancida]
MYTAPPPPYQEDTHSEIIIEPGVVTRNSPVRASPSLTDDEIEVFGHPVGPPACQSAPSPALPAIPVVSSEPPTRRPRGRPPRNPAPQAVESDPPTTFEALFTVLLPDKKILGRGGKKSKTEKQDPLQFGPFNVPLNVNWAGLQTIISDGLKTTVDCLPLSSIQWHFLKPANSPWLPLNTEPAMQSMLRQVEGKANAYVVFRMSPPLKKPSTALPWDDVSTSSTVAGGVDEDEQSDDNGHPVSKQRDGKATLELALIGGSFFKAENALPKVKTATLAPSMPTPAAPTPTTLTTPGTPIPGPLSAFNPYGFMMPTFFPQYGAPPYGMYPPFLTAQLPASLTPHAHSSRRYNNVRSSSPPVAAGNVDEFFELYNIDDTSQLNLQGLGFEIGDDLEGLPKAEWETVGFTYLTWQRVCKAYKKYRAHLKN